MFRSLILLGLSHYKHNKLINFFLFNNSTNDSSLVQDTKDIPFLTLS